ncbi:MAG TPA: MFS transporter [Candidatus Binataceae bacterium]|nr:MFS transporter [Candidatus Binataceae bacterium]
MNSAPTGACVRSERRVALHHAFAVFAGNGLEFYDFLTYSYFAVYIGRAFFPSADPTTSLLASLATFGVGFLTRPIGAIVIGSMGDRIGRKPAMLFSFALMGVSIAGLALTPSYAAIGVAAPLLAVFFRLVQGFALGGEVGPATAFMAELAPPSRRGLHLSMQYVTQDASALIAGLIGVVLAGTLTDNALQDWGWRAALLIGVAIVPFGLTVRRTLPETLAKSDAAPRQSMRTGLNNHRRLIAIGFVLIAAPTVSYYCASYMTTYALTTLKLPATIAFGLTVVNGGCSLVSELASGWLSDRFGRKPVMIVPCALLIAAIYPAFWIIAHFPNAFALYATESVLVILAATASVPAFIVVAEQLPASIRSGALATTYAFAAAIFGGSAQFAIALLIRVTGNPLVPGLYWGGAMIAALVAMVLVRDSAATKAEGRR